MTSAAADKGRTQARAVARQLVPTWRTRPFEAIEFLPGGYNNRNYHLAVAGGEYALRIAGAPPRPHEERYLAIAVAPEVVAHDAERGHLLTRWIAGPSFADAPPTPAEAGAFLADLHRQIPAGVREYDAVGHVATMLAATGGDAELTGLLRGLGWRPAAPRRGCHNDLNPWNILRGATGLRVLDWEAAGDNDPLFDVVGLCVGCRWGLREMERCRAAYEAAGGAAAANPRHLRATATLFYLREHAWAALIAARSHRKEIKAQAIAMRHAALRSAEAS